MSFTGYLSLFSQTFAFFRLTFKKLILTYLFLINVFFIVTFVFLMDNLVMKDLLSFKSIYKKYYNDVYRFSLYLSANEDHAKDISSETFLRMWTAKSSPRYETLKGYLFAIARNIYLQEQRNKKEYIDLNYNIPDIDPSPDRILEKKAELNSAMQILQEFPEIDRSILIMRAFKDLTYDEIAGIMKISVASVKIKIYRLRKKLEDKMNEKEGLK